MENIYLQIGSKIRDVRKKQNLTLEDLSDRAGLDWSFVARIERGKAVPSVMSLVKLSKALNISMAELFEKSSPPEDSLFEREIHSILNQLKTPEKERMLQILKLIIKTPSKKFKIISKNH
ncbi:MAG: hypothetical protein A2297_04980 [Elusimicrobia bacterium RIFOXYB2_FULL_48_7]|nr:MAG: hypothetical protein A2297_04980 [Elusimicrobia bacterium RIFOXYB2_FULL_48_7]